MAAEELLDKGRSSFERQAWSDSAAAFAKADGESPLEADDLERLATAAFLMGDDAGSMEVWARAHQAFLDAGHPTRAVRCAYWLAIQLMHKGERARGSGWIARARRILDDSSVDCPERGYLLFPVAIQRISEGDNAGALAAFSEAAECGERFSDPDLIALARHGQGRALIRMGKIAEGVELLDEAMASVEAGEVSPMATGDVYCSVIEACHEIFDVRRAHEWTMALTDWCESQPDLAPYRGQCLVRRAEIMQLHGDWPEALEEAVRAGERLSRPPGEPAAGAAFYRQAEIHRLRGAFDRAEECYLEGSKWGRKPQPGLAMLRLMQGRLDAAAAAIRREAGEVKDRAGRSRILPAYVEIMIATGETQDARRAADELSGIADLLGASYLHAIACQSHGSVLLAEGDARAALEPLREAAAAWADLDAPYETARVRALIGQACRRLRDEDTARLELEAACWTFRNLGATPDLEALTGAPESRHGLTPRELEVLRLVAAGDSNKAIAAELFISERTVERHVSNIFNKLNVSSRTAATAHAYAHQLL